VFYESAIEMWRVGGLSVNAVVWNCGFKDLRL